MQLVEKCIANWQHAYILLSISHLKLSHFQSSWGLVYCIDMTWCVLCTALGATRITHLGCYEYIPHLFGDVGGDNLTITLESTDIVNPWKFDTCATTCYYRGYPFSGVRHQLSQSGFDMPLCLCGQDIDLRAMSRQRESCGPCNSYPLPVLCMQTVDVYMWNPGKSRFFTFNCFYR